MDQVIIVGAGLGGLLLALLLETPPLSSSTSISPEPTTPPKIPYIILERSTIRKMPVQGGGVIFLTPQIHPLLERLGVLEELRKISRPVVSLTVYEATMDGSGSDDISPPRGGGGEEGAGGERSASVSGSGSVLEQPEQSGCHHQVLEPKKSGVHGEQEETEGALFSKTRYGYDTLAISRPELYNFLVDRIPEGKLMLGKQVQELVFQDIHSNTSIAAPSHGGGTAAPMPMSVQFPEPEPAPVSIIRSSGGCTEAEVDEVQVEEQVEKVGAEKEGSAMTIMPIVGKGSAAPTVACNPTATTNTCSTAAVVCTDGTRYEGIIVGADGAYSTVRLSLYRHLKEGLLATAAAEEGGDSRAAEVDADVRHGNGPMHSQFKVLVGMTRELDPDRFELLKNEYSDVRVLVSHNGDRPFMFWCVPMTGNKLCWMLDQQLAQEQTCPEIEDFTQDQQAIFNLSESVRSIRFPCGGEDNMRQAITLGEIILDSTPSGTPALLSREEGYFSTWTHGNIALMGDACHKALPYTGQPIAQAGFDAVQLANVLWSKYMDMYADSRCLDASLACSPPGTSSATSFSPAVCSHETKQRGEIMIELELDHVEKRLRCCWPCWVYDERRAEAEHAVQQAGRFARLLMDVGERKRKGAGRGSGDVGNGLEAHGLESLLEKERRKKNMEELQEMLKELQEGGK